MSGHAGGRRGSKRPGELRISPAARRPPFVVFFSIVWAQTRTTTDGHHVTKMHRIGCTVSMCCLTLSLSLSLSALGAPGRHTGTRVRLSARTPRRKHGHAIVVAHANASDYWSCCIVIQVYACARAATQRRGPAIGSKTISRISNNNKNNKSNTQWSAPRRPIPPAASPSLRGVKSPTLGLKPRSQC